MPGVAENPVAGFALLQSVSYIKHGGYGITDVIVAGRFQDRVEDS